jgi:hypothetical protein
VSDDLARVLKNPLRNRLLFEYGIEPTSPSRVARRLGASLNLVSYHTGVLRRKAYLELVRTERRRGATEHFYRSRVGPELEDEEWAAIPLALRRALISGTLGAAADDARRAALDGGFDGARAHLSRSLLRLDNAGADAVAHVLRAAVADIARIAAATREPDARAYELVILNFERPTDDAPRQV